jgi:dTDP-4-amino-4,6-dideoxygalactose transaminase
MAFLKEQGVGTGIHYPVPLHLQKAYQRLGYRQGDFPICEKVAREIVSLPMFPQLQSDQQQRVVQAVAEFVESKVAPLAR